MFSIFFIVVGFVVTWWAWGAIERAIQRGKDNRRG